MNVALCGLGVSTPPLRGRGEGVRVYFTYIILFTAWNPPETSR
jgi:hypothetical protein